MLPYFLADRCKEFRGKFEVFQESVIKMKDYLEKANVRTKVKNASTEPVRGFTDIFSFSIKVGTTGHFLTLRKIWSAK